MYLHYLNITWEPSEISIITESPHPDMQIAVLVGQIWHLHRSYMLQIWCCYIFRIDIVIDALYFLRLDPCLQLAKESLYPLLVSSCTIQETQASENLQSISQFQKILVLNVLCLFSVDSSRRLYAKDVVPFADDTTLLSDNSSSHSLPLQSQTSIVIHPETGSKDNTDGIWNRSLQRWLLLFPTFLIIFATSDHSFILEFLV